MQRLDARVVAKSLTATELAFPDGDPLDPKLLGQLPLRVAVDRHLVTNDMYLIHLEHLPANPMRFASGNRPDASPVDRFRAASGSLSDRRAHS
jgi:hypothetical protein